MLLPHPPHIILIPPVFSKDDLLSNPSMLHHHCSVCDVIYLLQRRMPWLEDRWRTQRTVLHISNCRFPRKIRILNAFRELGLPNSRGWRWPQYAVDQTLTFDWLSHVVFALFEADVIVAYSVFSLSNTDCNLRIKILCLAMFSCALLVSLLKVFSHVHDQLREYPLNLSI